MTSLDETDFETVRDNIRLAEVNIEELMKLVDNLQDQIASLRDRVADLERGPNP